MATARNGDDLAGGHDTPGCNATTWGWHWTHRRRPMEHHPVTVMLGGRYDPSPVMRINDEWNV